ncbi:FAD-dependent monooxygenase [Kitasatospora sp. RG8]|uniref:FAD-dependent monooxygenase n=1 Tax=Kitasatospora sp. RG8 TaxID=2820815 RepID=UPI001AE00A2F|nr:FAD-dependent monooxygenase [Kitasatospora sp. RG8]MBP0450087.1 FAD-dependent monooxygenase [Kitasatospora sp. RG8]
MDQAEPRAVVIGGGIGGLAAALALHRQGVTVTVHERAASLEPVGAGLALAPNALRALDRLGVGDRLRALATPHPAVGLRNPSGRWLARTGTDAMEAHFGEKVIAVPRAAVIDALADALPAGAVRTGSPAELVDPGSASRPAVVRSGDGEQDADLVVAADGIRSASRALLFPRHPGPRYSGFTTWRTIVAEPPRAPSAVGEVWGRGCLVGVVPLADGRVYVYGAALAPAGARAADGDERTELLRRYGDWCAPVPALLASADPAEVLRHDVWEIADPLPAHHRGRVALLGDAAHAMCPFQGQGACQAIEDAVVLAAGIAPGTDPAASLPAYTAARLSRTTAIAAGSRRIGALVARRSPVAVLLRDTALTVAGLLPDRVLLGRAGATYDWHPPAVPGHADRTSHLGAPGSP